MGGGASRGASVGRRWSDPSRKYAQQADVSIPQTPKGSNSTAGNSTGRVEIHSTRHLQTAGDSKADSDDSIDVDDYIVQCLIVRDVTHVFGGHGGAIVPLVNAIHMCKNIQWVLTRNELSASLAASAYAKLTKGLGCCIGTSGPGASHLASGLAVAQRENCALLCLTGMKKTAAAGYSDFQDINQTDLFRACGISYSQSILHKNAVVPLVRDAISVACTGCVCSHLAIPLDVQQAKLKMPPSQDESRVRIGGSDAIEQIRPHTDAIKQAANFLMQTWDRRENILFVIGLRGVDEIAASVLELAELLGVPVCTTQDAKGAINEAHNLFLGIIGTFDRPGYEASAEVVRSASVVVCVGVDDHSQILMGANGVQTARLIEIDKARLAGRRFLADHILAGDMNHVCEQLLETVRELHGQYQIQPERFKLHDVHKRAANYTVPQDEIRPGCCHPGMVMMLLGPKLRRGCVICVDSGDSAFWCSLCLCLDGKEKRVLASTRMGTMGYSIYGALAAAAVRPKSQIVGIAGAQAFQTALPELATLRQLDATVLFIVLSEGTAPSQMLGKMDLCKLGRAYEGNGIRLDSHELADVDQALDKGLSTKGIFIIEVVQHPDLKPFAIIPEFSDGSVQAREPFISSTSPPQPTVRQSFSVTTLSNDSVEQKPTIY